MHRKTAPTNSTNQTINQKIKNVKKPLANARSHTLCAPYYSLLFCDDILVK